MRIAGIDFSLNSPGVCIYETDKELNFENCEFYLNIRKPKKIDLGTNNKCENIHFNSQDEELIQKNGTLYQQYTLAHTIISDIFGHHYTEYKDLDVAVIEGYSLHARGLIFNIAEATGILKGFLFNNNVKIEIIYPTCSKKYFTGKGNATKKQMIDEFNSRFDINIAELMGYKSNYIKSPVTDIVDSYALVNYFVKQNFS